MNEQNAARSDAMNQFATSEANKISGLNAQNKIQVDDNLLIPLSSALLLFIF